MTLKDADRIAQVRGTVWYRGSPYTIYSIGKRYVRRGWVYKYIDLLDKNGRTIISANPEEVKETNPFQEQNENEEMPDDE